MSPSDTRIGRGTTQGLDLLTRGPAGQAMGQVGGGLLRSARHAGRALVLFVDACSFLPQIRRSMPTIMRLLESAGVGSILVLSLIAFLTGCIMALQTGTELEKFQIQNQLGAIIGATFVRELGPIWAAVIMLARVGGAMAAELGTMAVNEEIDALRMMSVNPVRYLVMPRLVALVVTMPLLTIIADWVGMAGGGVVSSLTFNVQARDYVESATSILTGVDFFSGMLKSAVFGAIIATIACDRGMNTYDGAEGVGRSTTETVVLSVVFVLLADLVLNSFILSILKPALGA
ncbi:MAG: ABC transporter permease [Planctomycetes bacterium]|nr:ABC transporter permease [Planctomycetota bacterium]